MITSSSLVEMDMWRPFRPQANVRVFRSPFGKVPTTRRLYSTHQTTTLGWGHGLPSRVTTSPDKVWANYCIHTYTYNHISNVSICTYIYTVHIYTHTCIHTYIYNHISNVYIHTYIYLMYTYVHIHIQIHYIHRYIHNHIHMCTKHTYTIVYILYT